MALPSLACSQGGFGGKRCCASEKRARLSDRQVCFGTAGWEAAEPFSLSPNQAGEGLCLAAPCSFPQVMPGGMSNAAGEDSVGLCRWWGLCPSTGGTVLALSTGWPLDCFISSWAS